MMGMNVAIFLAPKTQNVGLFIEKSCKKGGQSQFCVNNVCQRAEYISANRWNLGPHSPK